VESLDYKISHHQINN